MYDILIDEWNITINLYEQKHLDKKHIPRTDSIKRYQTNNLSIR